MADILDEKIVEEDGFGLDPSQLLARERSAIFETRINFGKRLRELGNSYYNSKKLEDALEAYQRGLYHLDFDEAQVEFELMDRHRDILFAAKVPLLINSAQTLVKMKKEPQVPETDAKRDEPKEGECKPLVERAGAQEKEEVKEKANQEAKEPQGGSKYQQALGFLNEALKLEPDNAKALFWRGRAHTALSNYEQAREDLLKAQEIHPDSATSTALQQLKILVNRHKQKQKRIWGGKFLSPSIDSSSDSKLQKCSSSQRLTSDFLGKNLLLFSTIFLTVSVGIALWIYHDASNS
mmetsp:Transcript_1757/g.2371  ORF Transcript_1757/g.2371 Transcript_1757/m.2371 type:complete len:294 (-) Transcript_1757:354-1235(-)